MTNTRDASLTCDFFGAVTPLLTTGSGVGHGAWGRGAWGVGGARGVCQSGGEAVGSCMTHDAQEGLDEAG